MPKVGYDRNDLLRYADLFLENDDRLNARRIYRYLLQQNRHDQEAQEGMQRASGKPGAEKSELPLPLDDYLKSSKTGLTLPEIVKALAQGDLSVSERGYLLLAAGVAHFQSGNHLQARHHYEKALELNPNNSRAHCGLGMVHWASW